MQVLMKHGGFFIGNFRLHCCSLMMIFSNLVFFSITISALKMQGSSSYSPTSTCPPYQHPKNTPKTIDHQPPEKTLPGPQNSSKKASQFCPEHAPSPNTSKPMKKTQSESHYPSKINSTIRYIL